MNMKSYFRGIGAGIIVAAIVMGVSKTPKAMTEAEIKTMAKQLGMVESSTLLEIESEKENSTSINIEETNNNTSIDTMKNEDSSASANEEVNKDSDSNIDDNTSHTVVTDKEDITSGKEETTSDKEEATVSDSNSNEQSEADLDTQPEDSNQIDKSTSEITPIDPFDGEAGFSSKEEYVEVKVIRGDSSVSVARRMFEAGLVESAVEFDRFLCGNGYDKSISVGTYEIAYGLDYESMAKIITKRN